MVRWFVDVILGSSLELPSRSRIGSGGLFPNYRSLHQERDESLAATLDLDRADLPKTEREVVPDEGSVACDAVESQSGPTPPRDFRRGPIKQPRTYSAVLYGTSHRETVNVAGDGRLFPPEFGVLPHEGKRADGLARRVGEVDLTAEEVRPHHGFREGDLPAVFDAPSLGPGGGLGQYLEDDREIRLGRDAYRDRVSLPGAYRRSRHRRSSECPLVPGGRRLFPDAMGLTAERTVAQYPVDNLPSTLGGRESGAAPEYGAFSVVGAAVGAGDVDFAYVGRGGHAAGFRGALLTCTARVAPRIIEQASSNQAETRLATSHDAPTLGRTTPEAVTSGSLESPTSAAGYDRIEATPS
jgi:hypothetical protein